MKTIKFFSVLSLVLIFARVITIYPETALTQNSKPVSKATIRYEVYINLPKAVTFCNTYLVQLSDEKGNPVVHPQAYIPGINKYVFIETVSVLAKVRVASFEIVQDPSIIGCPINLITKPDVGLGPFFPFQTYYFNLYPEMLR